MHEAQLRGVKQEALPGAAVQAIADDRRPDAARVRSVDAPLPAAAGAREQARWVAHDREPRILVDRARLVLGDARRAELRGRLGAHAAKHMREDRPALASARRIIRAAMAAAALRRLAPPQLGER